MREGAIFGGDINLENAKIGGNLYISASKFFKSLNADSVTVGKDLLMNKGSIFSGDVDLDSAKIGGGVYMDSSSFSGNVKADSMNVEKDFSMSGLRRPAMAQEFKPCEIVPQSGVYRIIHDPVHADMPHEVTVIKGRRFPTCRHCKGVRFELTHAAKHVSEIDHFEAAQAPAQ